MIVIWGNTRGAVLANLMLAAVALAWGVSSAARGRSVWGFLGAAFFLVMAVTAEIARRSSSRGGAATPNEILDCPDCGFVNTPGWNFCSNCGSMRRAESPRKP